MNEAKAQWALLLDCSRLSQGEHVIPEKNKQRLDEGKDSSEQEEEFDDPFECRSITIPPPTDLVDCLADEFVERWRDLDDRKISLSSNHREGNGTGGPNNRLNEIQVHFPDGFDFATVRSKPPEDDGSGDRIISLDDFTQAEQESYHVALWKLFASIPTSPAIEAPFCISNSKDSTLPDGCLPHTRKVFHEIAETVRDVSRADCHARVRLRMNDRHEPPPPPTSHNHGHPVACNRLYGSLRFEFLKAPCRRESLPDPNRAVVEFSESHTLLDVHNTLVQLLDDNLWTQLKKKSALSKIDSSKGPSTTVESIDDSGFFFFEGVFYTTGTVEYVATVQHWLKQGTQKERIEQAQALGIERIIQESQPLPIRSMESQLLGGLKLRLGMRYVHVCHGDVECAVYLTDRQVRQYEPDHLVPFPIYHDVFSFAAVPPECHLCRHRTATFVTAPTCTATRGLRALCTPCVKDLGLHQNIEQLQSFGIWRSQGNLSAGFR